MQHKNVNITWDYCNFPRHPFAAEKSEIIGRNTIISYYHYRVDQEHDKGVCGICRFPCACPNYVAELDKYWLPTIPPSSQLRYAHVEIVTIKKYLNITMIG